MRPDRLLSHPSVIVMRKELREAVRERRSLVSALFYAVWGPAVMAIALLALARDRGPEPPLTLPVQGHGHAEALTGFLAERSVTLAPAPDDPVQAVRARTLTVALMVDRTYVEDFSAARPARLTLVYDGSWSASAKQAARVRTLLGDYARRVGDTRLILRGISPTAVAPLRIAERDVSTPAGRAATVLSTLPIFVLLAAFIGGMGTAADVTAGERERGSLESLLLYPVPRWALVAGKWAAASAVCLATVTLTLIVSRLVLAHPRIQAMDVPVGLSLSDAVGMWLVLAPLALLATAVQLFVAMFAKTYKEAQTHLSLFAFLPMLPGFMFAFGSLEARAWMHALPMVGHHVMISDLLRGQPPTSGAAAGLAAITLAAAAVVLAGASRLLRREAIVRRAAG